VRRPLPARRSSWRSISISLVPTPLIGFHGAQVLCTPRSCLGRPPLLSEVEPLDAIASLTLNLPAAPL
jgi:hypothetical protein